MDREEEKTVWNQIVACDFEKALAIFVGNMDQMVHKQFAGIQSVAEINMAITMHEEMCQNRAWNICRDML